MFFQILAYIVQNFAIWRLLEKFQKVSIAKKSHDILWYLKANLQFVAIKSDFFKKMQGVIKLKNRFRWNFAQWKRGPNASLGRCRGSFRGIQSKGKNRFLAITFHRKVRSSPYFYCRLVSWVLNFLCGLSTVAPSTFSKIMKLRLKIWNIKLHFPGCCPREFSQNTHRVLVRTLIVTKVCTNFWLSLALPRIFF